MHSIYIHNLIIWSSLLVTLIGAASTVNSCRTRTNDAGICVPLDDCETLKSLVVNLQRGPNSRATTILQQSQCGYDNTQIRTFKKILVCCPAEQVKSDIENRFSNPDNDAALGNVLPEPGVCGKFLENKIVGGNKTDINEFPWMALLFYKNDSNNYVHLCGGSLINTRYVLTAAHCISSGLLEGWNLSHVRLGEWDLHQNPDCTSDNRFVKECALPHLDIDIESKIVHELYASHSAHQLYDIGLLRLATAVTYNIFVKPICLPLTQQLQSANLKDRSMAVAGWGETSSAAFSPIKLKVNLKGWSLEDCFQKYKLFNFYLNQTQICAGGEQDIDTCGGDSGGPLMIKEIMPQGSIYFVAGIVSYGQTPCGSKGWPSVNTNVGSFVDWIQNNLQR